MFVFVFVAVQNVRMAISVSLLGISSVFEQESSEHLPS